MSVIQYQINKSCSNNLRFSYMCHVLNLGSIVYIETLSSNGLARCHCNVIHFQLNKQD